MRHWFQYTSSTTLTFTYVFNKANRTEEKKLNISEIVSMTETTRFDLLDDNRSRKMKKKRQLIDHCFEDVSWHNPRHDLRFPLPAAANESIKWPRWIEEQKRLLDRLDWFERRSLHRVEHRTECREDSVQCVRSVLEHWRRRSEGKRWRSMSNIDDDFDSILQHKERERPSIDLPSSCPSWNVLSFLCKCSLSVDWDRSLLHSKMKFINMWRQECLERHQRILLETIRHSSEEMKKIRQQMNNHQWEELNIEGRREDFGLDIQMNEDLFSKSHLDAIEILRLSIHFCSNQFSFLLLTCSPIRFSTNEDIWESNPSDCR